MEDLWRSFHHELKQVAGHQAPVHVVVVPHGVEVHVPNHLDSLKVFFGNFRIFSLFKGVVYIF